MNTQETNTVLDLSENDTVNTKPEWRPYFLAIESIVFIIILLTGRFSLSVPFAAQVCIILTLSFTLFHFIVPIIKLVRKEIKAGLFILYMIQALALAVCLVGLLFKLQSWPYASEFIMAGIMPMWLFFILIPNVEIRKYKAKGIIHLMVTVMGLAMVIGYMGIIFRIESWPYGSEFITAATVLIIPISGWILFKIWRDKEHFYLKYYLPRIALMIFFLVNYLT